MRRNDDQLRCVKPSPDLSFLKGLSCSALLCKRHWKVVSVGGSSSLCPSFALLHFYLRRVGIKTKKNSSAPSARQLPENLSLVLINIAQEITSEYQSTYKNEVHPE